MQPKGRGRRRTVAQSGDKRNPEKARLGIRSRPPRTLRSPAVRSLQIRRSGASNAAASVAYSLLQRHWIDDKPPPLLRYSALSLGFLFGLGFSLATILASGLVVLVLIELAHVTISTH